LTFAAWFSPLRTLRLRQGTAASVSLMQVGRLGLI